MHIGRQRDKNHLGLYFAGHLTIEATIDRLLETSSLGVAEHVLLSGGSAGGFGTFHHSDWLYDKLATHRGQLPAAPALPPLTFASAPQAGAFFVNKELVLMAEFATLNTSLNFARFASEYLYRLMEGGTGADPSTRPFLDETCVAEHANEPAACWSAVAHYPYISTRVFVAQNRFDSSQAGDVLGANWWPLPLRDHSDARSAFLVDFGRRTVDGIVAQVKASSKPQPDGLFVPSCYQHTDNLCMRATATRINNITFAEALFAWFFARQTVPPQLVDGCGDGLCNPSCSC